MIRFLGISCSSSKFFKTFSFRLDNLNTDSFYYTTMAAKAGFLFMQLVVMSFNYESVSCYCWSAGKNPGFKGPPKITQISLDTVRVSWENLVINRECADSFVVKYWPTSTPDKYRVTMIVEASENSVNITVKAGVQYHFQAVAREDKGVIGGVDWNKSPPSHFTTSSFQEQVRKWRHY